MYPKTFLKPGRGLEPLTRLNEEIFDSTSAIELFSQLREAVRRAKDAEIRSHLGRMMATVADIINHNSAAAIADNIGLERHFGRSIGECAMAATIAAEFDDPDDKRKWRRMYADSILETVNMQLDDKIINTYSGVVHPTFMNDFAPLCPFLDLYLMRTSRGELVIVKYDTVHEGEITASWGGLDDINYYISQGYSFYSPVWQVRRLIDMMHGLLAAIGYVPMIIKGLVIFTNASARIVNPEVVAKEGGKLIKVWDRSMDRQGPPFPTPAKIFGIENECFSDMDLMIARTLRAMEFLMSRCEFQETFNHPFDKEDILRLARKYRGCIFTSPFKTYPVK